MNARFTHYTSFISRVLKDIQQITDQNSGINRTIYEKRSTSVLHNTYLTLIRTVCVIFAQMVVDCDVAWLSHEQSCTEFSRPYRVLRIKSLTRSQSVLSRWKQGSRYIFATQADVKSELTLKFRVAILT